MNKFTVNNTATISSKFRNIPSTSRNTSEINSREKIVEITIGTFPTLPSKCKNSLKANLKSKSLSLPVKKITAKKIAKTANEEMLNSLKSRIEKATTKSKNSVIAKSQIEKAPIKQALKITKVTKPSLSEKLEVKKINVKSKKSKTELADQLSENMVLNYRLKARKLARSILRKWHSRLDIEEVDSVVDLSLCEAVKRYDARKGASFMTFMFYHLRGNLIRTVATAANTTIVPLLDQESSNYEDSNQSSWMNRGIVRGVTANEVADALTGGDREQPDYHLLKKELANLSRSACGKLDGLEQEVIRRIYEQEEQLLDIAQTLGYSRCHISRVKRRALESLFDELKGPLEVDKNFRPAFEDEDAPQGRKYKIKRARRRRDLTDFLPSAEVM